MWHEIWDCDKKCPQGAASFGPCQMILHKKLWGEVHCVSCQQRVIVVNKCIKSLHCRWMIQKTTSPQPSQSQQPRTSSPWLGTFVLNNAFTAIIVKPFHRKPNCFWQNDRTPYLRWGSSSCVLCTVQQFQARLTLTLGTNVTCCIWSSEESRGNGLYCTYLCAVSAHGSLLTVSGGPSFCTVTFYKYPSAYCIL